MVLTSLVTRHHSFLLYHMFCHKYLWNIEFVICRLVYIVAKKKEYSNKLYNTISRPTKYLEVTVILSAYNNC